MYTYVVDYIHIVERQLSLRVVDASVGRHTEALFSASRWYCCIAWRLVPNPSFQRPVQQRIALQVQLCIVRYLSVHVSLTERCMQTESFPPQMRRIGNTWHDLNSQSKYSTAARTLFRLEPWYNLWIPTGAIFSFAWNYLSIKSISDWDFNPDVTLYARPLVTSTQSHTQGTRGLGNLPT